MQKDSAHSDVVWGICAELLASRDPCLIGQGAATLRSLLGIPGFRLAVARGAAPKCGVGSALPHMAGWSPATRCVHAALQLLVAEHSDERVLQDVLASLQLLLAASFGSEAVVAVCSSGGAAADNKMAISLWQLVSRLTCLSLHPIPSLANDALVTLSLLSCNPAGAAVCVLNRAASLLLWQVMCRCLQVVSSGSAAAAEEEQRVESKDIERPLEVSPRMPVLEQQHGADAAVARAAQQQDAAESSCAQDEAGPEVEGAEQTASTEALEEAEHTSSSPKEATPTATSPKALSPPAQRAASPQPAKAFERRTFMSDRIHGSCEHSFAAGCTLTSDAYLLQPGVVELLLYCSMHACINCCTVCVSLKRTQPAAHSLATTALLSCSFGCTTYAHPFLLSPPQFL